METPEKKAQAEFACVKNLFIIAKLPDPVRMILLGRKKSISISFPSLIIVHCLKIGFWPIFALFPCLPLFSHFPPRISKIASDDRGFFFALLLSCGNSLTHVIWYTMIIMISIKKFYILMDIWHDLRLSTGGFRVLFFQLKWHKKMRKCARRRRKKIFWMNVKFRCKWEKKKLRILRFGLITF